MTNKVRANSIYRFEPVGWDIVDKPYNAQPGLLYRVVNLPGCPRANTMGHCYIADLDGNFAGLVHCNSLVKEG